MLLLRPRPGCGNRFRRLDHLCISSASSGLEGRLRDYAQREQVSVNLRTLLETGTGDRLFLTNHKNGQNVQCQTQATNQILLQISSFLHRELPVRLAHRARELDRLPFGLAAMPTTQVIRKWYTDSFSEVLAVGSPVNMAEEQQFAEICRKIHARHSDALVTMAEVLFEFKQSGKMQEKVDQRIRQHQHEIELRKELRENRRQERAAGTHNDAGAQFSASRESEWLTKAENDRQRRRAQEAWKGEGVGTDLADLPEVHEVLDAFFMSRIGLRVLIGQYLELHEEANNDYIGLICKRTSPADIAQFAIEDASMLCQRQLNVEPPEVQLLGRTDLSFAYIPSHLYYMLFELIKNSLRATVERHAAAAEASGHFPPVQVVIGDGEQNEDVVIKISDHGGGIPRSNLSRIFSYLFTTAKPSFAIDSASKLRDFGRNSPLAGLGYGLPISRGYARYFGGDLRILSVEGHGTDAYIYLSRLGDNSEPLP